MDAHISFHKTAQHPKVRVEGNINNYASWVSFTEQ
jgi:hypothetical protein